MCQYTLNRQECVEVDSEDTRTLISILLQRKRELSGLSLAQVAEKIGASSRNTFARYERGKSIPSVEKLNELLHAVSPKQDIVLKESTLQ
jgi:transcriptional regulator with XRE-family HTH domain